MFSYQPSNKNCPTKPVPMMPKKPTKPKSQQCAPTCPRTLKNQCFTLRKAGNSKHEAITKIKAPVPTTAPKQRTQTKTRIFNLHSRPTTPGASRALETWTPPWTTDALMTNRPHQDLRHPANAQP